MKVGLSDPSRFPDLRDFFQCVQAVAEISGEVVVVGPVGVAGPRQEERQLRAYLDTWLSLYREGVEVRP